VKSQTVYSFGPFGRAGEYVIVQPLGSMADFDGQSPIVKALGQPASARLNERVRKCIDSQTAYMSTRWDDASNITETPPNVIVSARYRLAAEKAADIRAIIKSDVLPVYKKGNVYLSVSARGPGANPNDITNHRIQQVRGLGWRTLPDSCVRRCRSRKNQRQDEPYAELDGSRSSGARCRSELLAED